VPNKQVLIGKVTGSGRPGFPMHTAWDTGDTLVTPDEDPLLGVPYNALTHVITSIDATNGWIPVSTPISDPSKVFVFVNNAPYQGNGTDYGVDIINNRITWVGLGLAGILGAGDVMTVLFY